MIQPITPKAPTCLGVCCDKHHNCARYHNIETYPNEPRIATCDYYGNGARPMFIRLEATK